MTIAPVISLNCRNVRLTTVVRRMLFAFALGESLSGTNTMPWFGAAPAKLKPSIANVPRTSSCFLRIFSTCFVMFVV